MPSKRILSWSKRQMSPEPYYRTGGLLPIDTLAIESSDDLDAKVRCNDPENKHVPARETVSLRR